MSKKDQEQTKNVQNTVHADSSVTTTKNTMVKNCLPKKLSYDGTRLLAIGVIKSAIFNEEKKIDIRFFKSDAFDFWANLAYGCKPEYVEGVHIPSLVRKNMALNNEPSTRVRCTRKE